MNKFKIILFSVILYLAPIGVVKLYSQPFNNACVLSLANISTVADNQWNAQKNPAAAANNDKIFIGASFANLYNIKQLNYMSALLLMPIRNNNFSLSASIYGIPEYKESTFTMAYGKALTPKFNFGLAFNYHQLAILNQNNQRAFSINIGAQYLLIQNLLLGIFLENITNGRYGKQSVTEKPSSFNLGLAYFLNKKKVKLFSEIRKSLDYLTDFAFAIDYNIVEWLSVTTGISTTPLKQYYGIRLQLKGVAVNISYNNNRNLSSFPAISMDYKF